VKGESHSEIGEVGGKLNLKLGCAEDMLSVE